VDITVAHRRLTLTVPLVTAHGPIVERNLTEVAVSKGHSTGWGEAAPLPGFRLETHEDAVAALQRWADTGERPEERSAPSAAAAVATAETTLEAARSGRSLALHLGGRPPTNRPLAVQALVGGSDPDDVRRACTVAVAGGHRAIKLKVGATTPDVDIGRIRAARAAIGGDLLLRLDANQGWDLDTAIRVLGAVNDLDIDVVEEPTPDLNDFPEIARRTGLRLGADETLTDADAVTHVLDHEWIDTIVVKPAVLGGPLRTAALIRTALERGRRVVVSSFIDGPIGLRATRDLAIALVPDGVHGIGTATLFDDELPVDVTPIAGLLHPDPALLELPSTAPLVRTTSTIAGAETPTGLLAQHRVASDRWACLRVLAGEVRFHWEIGGLHRTLAANDRQVIPPDVTHHIEPAPSSSFEIDFHRWEP